MQVKKTTKWQALLQTLKLGTKRQSYAHMSTNNSKYIMTNICNFTNEVMGKL